MAPEICRPPRHPRTGLYAVGISKSGRPWWPIMGGDESADAVAQAAAAAKANADKAAADAATAAAVKESGFPDSTAVADMSAEQQAAYWKFHSRKHEERASALGNLTPEQITELQAKAKKADDLEAAKGTDTERAVRSAHEAAEQAAAAKFQPMLVHAKFEAVVAGRIPADKLTTILAPLDTKHFLAADGTVDTAKVNSYVEGILPAQTKTPGPSSGGHGGHGGTNAGGSAQERAEARAIRLGLKKPAAK